MSLKISSALLTAKALSSLFDHAVRTYVKQDENLEKKTDEEKYCIEYHTAV
jgi:hypothetical protein